VEISLLRSLLLLTEKSQTMCDVISGEL
jgi:hypothetical protein